MTTNRIKFESTDIETAKGSGSISTLTFDLDITVEPIVSDNPMAPPTVSLAAHHVVASSNVAASGRSKTAKLVLTTFR